MSTATRKRLIQKLRREGRTARFAGRHIQTCLHKFMDEFQWRKGWREADEELQREAAEQREQCS